ncbi:hypothetical protein EPUL_006393 [Erysiphe pulchra]|uniref:Calcipressin n=1 Tax=Erysiphe pulchra TaxID=225359 RepID=A0A2S4PKG4_9PEZI|nr:hypothetical protein EPUL_006393 [Erysiphe pulchra]
MAPPFPLITVSEAGNQENIRRLSIKLEGKPLLLLLLLDLKGWGPREPYNHQRAYKQSHTNSYLAPLKSFRRIIVSFFDINSAIQIRQLIENDAILGEQCKVYFGQPTSIETKEAHLNLPDAGKLFFISPPPSPPHGWENRLEDAPNKQVVAEDLAKALKKLHTSTRSCFPESPISEGEDIVCRARSASCTTIYRPEEHGGSPNLPAINVEDMTGDDCEPIPMEQEKPIYAHTSRPPLELMDLSTS